MDAILNELSIPPVDGLAADLRATRLVSSLRSLLAHGMNRVLRTTREAPDTIFEKDTSLRRWLFSRGGNTEEKRFLARLLDKAPYVEELHHNTEDSAGTLFEFEVSAKRARGLGVAFLLDFPALSFVGYDVFGQAFVQLEFTGLKTEVQETARVNVIHVATPDHVLGHRPWIEDRLQRTVATGEELWRRRLELFPQLDFCASTERQMRALFGTEPFFCEIVRHLHVLSRTVLEWESGEFDPPLRWSHESTVTLDNPTFRAARKFTCQDSVQRVFSHSKMGHGGKRVYFFPDPTKRRIWIGHVGDHLATVLYR
jgi:hypothetical protein